MRRKFYRNCKIYITSLRAPKIHHNLIISKRKIDSTTLMKKKTESEEVAFIAFQFFVACRFSIDAEVQLGPAEKNPVLK